MIGSPAPKAAEPAGSLVGSNGGERLSVVVLRTIERLLEEERGAVKANTRFQALSVLIRHDIGGYAGWLQACSGTRRHRQQQGKRGRSTTVLNGVNATSATLGYLPQEGGHSDVAPIGAEPHWL